MPKGTNDIIISWDTINKDCETLARQITESGECFTSIMAVARGGLVVAAVLSYLLNIQKVDTICVSSYDSHNKKGIIKMFSNDFKSKNCLLVDDLVDSGDTLKHILDWKKEKIKTAVLYKKRLDSETFTPDYCVADLPNHWIKFPWEI